MKWPFGSKKEEKGKKEVDYYPEYPKDIQRLASMMTTSTDRTLVASSSISKPKSQGATDASEGDTKLAQACRAGQLEGYKFKPKDEREYGTGAASSSYVVAGI